jgi:hypothetical protein
MFTVNIHCQTIVLYTQLELTAQLHRAGEIEFRKHVGGTFGRHSTYDDDDEGRAALKAAEDAKAKNAIEVAKAKAVAAEKMARRAEAGLY